jgi:NADH-quinone oxidoreductase subunit D
MEPLEHVPDVTELELEQLPMLLNVGPSHPMTHGTVRLVLKLSGETVEAADVQVGFLHRGFEKMCERGTWTQAFPYVERCNYVSPMLGNVAFALACEKLLGAEVPLRCQYYRMILGELARITDHLTCTAAIAMDLGAFTPFLWFMRAREMIYDVLEEETGARITHCFERVGGTSLPPTSGFPASTRAALEGVLAAVREVEGVLLKNRVFLDRLEGVGRISAADAVSLGFTGPCLRASGVPYDVRKAHPYLKYGEIEFEVPVGSEGDCLDRFQVRLEEIRQCARIVEQCLERIPTEGPMQIDDVNVVLPPKEEVYTTIEGTIQHFKIVMEGLKLPAGEIYSYTEASNGELGFYLLSDGSGTPVRFHVRGPCFYTTAGLERIITGQMLADVVPCFGSVNMVGGECDR